MSYNRYEAAALVYDQGFEYKPVDFDETNADPQSIIDMQINPKSLRE